MVVRIGRHDVSESTIPSDEAGVTSSSGAVDTQPSIWTFIDFEAPDERADALARALAGALRADDGWWADFVVGEDHVVIFAGKIFKYRIGDSAGRDAAVQYGLAVGTPRHQLDWGD